MSNYPSLFPEAAIAPVAVPEAEEGNERYTPEYVLDVARAVAPFAIDPFTTPDNRTRAAEFCYRGGPLDGNRADWAGACARHGGLAWFQPPYSRGKIDEAVASCVREAKRGAEIIGLLTADLSTEWGARIFEHADAIAFWNGRIEFVRPGERFEAGFNKPSMLPYFGERAKKFAAAFRPHAHVVSTKGWW